MNPDGEEGNRLEVVIPERQTRYSLIFSDLSPKDAARPVDDVFRDLGAIYAKTPGGAPARLLKELAITDRGFPGREYQFAVGDRFVTRIKVFVNGARLPRDRGEPAGRGGSTATRSGSSTRSALK